MSIRQAIFGCSFVVLAVFVCSESIWSTSLHNKPLDKGSPKTQYLSSGSQRDTTSMPSSQMEDNRLKEKLQEIAAKAATNPDAYATFEMHYVRGHELSGMTEFKVNAAGEYTLNSNVTSGRREVVKSGILKVNERNNLLRAINETELLKTPPSTRNIGDDEQPVIITVSYDNMSYRLTLWHEDAKNNPSFHNFELSLLAIMNKIADDAILNTLN